MALRADDEETPTGSEPADPPSPKKGAPLLSDDPVLGKKIAALHREAGAYRVRARTAEREAGEARATADRERLRREALERAFRELTERIQGLGEIRDSLR